MSRFNYILFDWDGCLSKTLDIWLDAYKKVVIKRGIDISKMSDFEFVEKSFGKWAQGFANLGVTDPDQAYKEAIDITMRNYANAELYSSAEEVLIELKNKGKKIALLTSAYRSWIEKPLKLYNLEHYFDAILAKDDVIKGKPDPEIVIKALEIIKGNVDESLIIGDSDLDIKAGKAAGIKTVIFYPPENERFYKRQELEEENPDYLITNFQELLKIVS